MTIYDYLRYIVLSTLRNVLQMDQSASSVNYRIFKTELKLESNLLELEPKHSVPLCKFRTNNHYLPVIVGRYKQIEYSNRICTLCKNNDVGDEFHYLFKCSFFNAERHKFVDHNYTHGANTLKMNHLFNSKDLTELKNLACFAKIIMNQCKATHQNPAPISTSH